MHSEPLKPTPHPALAESADDDRASAAQQITLPARTRVRTPDTVSPPGSAPPHIDTFAARPWSHRTGPVQLSNSGSNRARHLRPLPQIPTADRQIERSDRGSARKGSGTLLSVHSLPAPAAARLFPGSSIKALDPVGTASYCLITTNRQKVTENFREEVILNPLNYTIDSRASGSTKLR